MQLILNTVPVLREEDRQDLLQVTPQWLLLVICLQTDLLDVHTALFNIGPTYVLLSTTICFMLIVRVNLVECCVNMQILKSVLSFSQVMPSYVSYGWRVKKPFSGLLPEVDAQGEWREVGEESSGEKMLEKQYEIKRGQIRVMEDVRSKKDTEDSSFSELKR